MLERRAEVVREAESWRGTPFRLNQCVKGSGVDCGRFIAAVYRACGFDIPAEFEAYRPNWHQNTHDERYLDLISTHLREVTVPEPGDLALFRLRRNYPFSHAGIVVSWPRKVLHANGLQKHDAVQEIDCSLSPASYWETRFFSPIR